MRSTRSNQDAGDAFGTVPPPHASQAFGATRASAPQWLAARVRLVVLLIYLGLSMKAFLDSEKPFVAEDRTSASLSSPGGGSSPSVCEPEQPPRLITVNASQFLALRASVQTVMSHAGGSRYAWGTISPRDAWADNEPESATAESSTTGRWPGSFEIRQWASDPQWGASYSDDIVADVFAFSTSTQALRFYSEATSTRCRIAASATPASRAPDARDLNWVNPDHATEEDVFLLRARIVYRIVDVRPQNQEPPPSRAEDQIGFTTAETLACTLPEARCSQRRSTRT
jgi:hypothetical protein